MSLHILRSSQQSLTDGIITLSFFFRPNDIRAKCKAAVPVELQASANFDLTASLNSFSIFSTYSPV